MTSQTQPAPTLASHAAGLPCGPDGKAQAALRQAEAALSMAARSGRPFAIAHALTQVGRCWRGLQALAAAETHFEQALVWARVTGSTDQVVDLLCALAETAVQAADGDSVPAAAQAARDRAHDHALEAAGLAGRVADALWEVRVLLRVGDVLDRCGDHHNAVLLQGRALQRMAALGEADDPGQRGALDGAVEARLEQTTVAASL